MTITTKDAGNTMLTTSDGSAQSECNGVLDIFDMLDEYFNEDEIRADAKRLTKKELIEEVVKLTKRVDEAEYFRDILFGPAVVDRFYFDPEWDGSEIDDEKEMAIINKWASQV